MSSISPGVGKSIEDIGDHWSVPWVGWNMAYLIRRPFDIAQYIIDI